MTDDFSETLKSTLEQCAATLSAQDETWSRVRAAFAQLDGNTLVSADGDLLEEIDAACAPKRAPSNSHAVGAIRA